MKKARNQRIKNEQLTDCIIRFMFAGLVVVMIVSASFSLLMGQPIIIGLVLLICAIVFAAMTLRYKRLELFCKLFKIRLKK